MRKSAPAAAGATARVKHTETSGALCAGRTAVDHRQSRTEEGASPVAVATPAAALAGRERGRGCCCFSISCSCSASWRTSRLIEIV